MIKINVIFKQDYLVLNMKIFPLNVKEKQKQGASCLNNYKTNSK